MEEKEQIKKETMDFLALLGDEDIKQKVEEIVKWEVEVATKLGKPERQGVSGYQNPGGEIDVIDKILGWVKDFIFKRLQRREREDE